MPCVIPLPPSSPTLLRSKRSKTKILFYSTILEHTSSATKISSTKICFKIISEFVMFEIFIFYFLFLESGLVHLLPSFLFSFNLNNDAIEYIKMIITSITSLPCPSWKYAVYALCVGHVLHCYRSYQLVRTSIIFIISILIVTIAEEISLRSGLIFGHYSFTTTLGYKFTEHFPLLALGCWICLIYPNLLLTNLILSGSPSLFPKLSQSRIFLSSILGATLLTCFDIISEPIHVKYGHQLWHHAAYIDPVTPLLTFTQQPDWIFAPNQPFQEIYFGIPFQNFVGWFVSSFVVNYFILSALASLNDDTSSGSRHSPPSSRSSSSSSYLFSISPIITALVCVQIYLCLHPCHPPLVRLLASLYVLLVSFVLIWRGMEWDKRGPSKFD